MIEKSEQKHMARSAQLNVESRSHPVEEVPSAEHIHTDPKHTGEPETLPHQTEIHETKKLSIHFWRGLLALIFAFFVVAGSAYVYKGANFIYHKVVKRNSTSNQSLKGVGLATDLNLRSTTEPNLKPRQSEVQSEYNIFSNAPLTPLVGSYPGGYAYPSSLSYPNTTSSWLVPRYDPPACDALGDKYVCVNNTPYTAAPSTYAYPTYPTYPIYPMGYPNPYSQYPGYYYPTENTGFYPRVSSPPACDPVGDRYVCVR
jgi:hypothetical protein